MRRITIIDENGIHARPASEIIVAASKYDGNVFIIKSGKKMIVKDVLALMDLALFKGDTIEIIADGKDSDKIESEIENIILNSG